MSFWGKVFGTDEAIKGAVSAVRDGLDALVYTDEEKASDAAKERSEARSMLVGWMEATQGQNLARRLISLAITGVWLFQYLIAQAAMSVAIFWEGKGDQLKALAKVNTDSANEMSSAVMLILAFYFAAPHMGDFAQAIVGRFKARSEAGPGAPK
jgi:hypothetical protein